MSARTAMSVGIAGIGVVTPLGFEVEEVARRLGAGERGRRVENFDILAFTTSDRLRRSPLVSLFAVAAAARAVNSAGLTPGSFDGARVAVIGAVSKGAVLYSERFHGQFVKGGGKGVVPLLFPETVANAPASHVAAVFGLQGPNATLLGDAGVAHNAIAMARDWLEWELADRVLVVAPHEHSEIMAKGYASFRGLFRGAPWSEGAAALLLTRGPGRDGTVVHVDRGFPFRRRSEIAGLLEGALSGLPAEADVVAVSGGEPALPFAAAPRLAIKESLGEAFAAGALWQIVFGLQRTPPGRHLLSTCVGLNEQVSVLMARR
jgi:hypothetical protein